MGGTFLTAVGYARDVVDGATAGTAGARPETPFSQYMSKVRAGEKPAMENKWGLKPKEKEDKSKLKPKPRKLTEEETARAKAEMQIRKQTFEKLQKSYSANPGQLNHMVDLRPMSSSIPLAKKPPKPAPTDIGDSVRKSGSAAGATRIGSVVPFSDSGLVSGSDLEGVGVDPLKSRLFSPAPSGERGAAPALHQSAELSMMQTKQFEPFQKPGSAAHRPPTGMSKPRLLPAIPPADMFKRPSTSADGRPSTGALPFQAGYGREIPTGRPATSQSAVSIGRKSRNAAGVTTMEIKAGGEDSQVLTLDHDALGMDKVTAAAYRATRSDFPEEFAYEKPEDKFVPRAIDRQFEAMQATTNTMEKLAEPNLRYTTQGVLTPEVRQELEEFNKHRELNERNALIYEGGHDYPFTEKDFVTFHYNKVLQVLKTRVNQKGLANVAKQMERHDLQRTGILTLEEFQKALEDELNMRVPAFVTERLIHNVGAVRETEDGPVVHYPDLVQKIRYNQLPYLEHTPVTSDGKKRPNPDLDLPFGYPNDYVPYAVMTDAVNGIKTFDNKVSNLIDALETSFKGHGNSNKQTVSWPQFRASMEHMSEKKGLKLTKFEIANLYKFGAKDKDGQFLFQPWIEKLRVEEGAHQFRQFPDFLKQKASRCSVKGFPWVWDANAPYAQGVEKIGSRSFAEPELGAGSSWEDKEAKPYFVASPCKTELDPDVHLKD